VAEGKEEGLPLGDAESRGDAVRVSDPVPLRVPVAETLAHSVVLKEAVKVLVALAQSDPLEEPLAEGDVEEEGVLETERHSEGLTLGDPVLKGEAVSDSDPSPLRVPVAETLALCEALREIAGEPDALTQPELLGEARSDPDAEEEGVNVAVRHSEGDAVCEGGAEALGGDEPQADGERDAAGERVAEAQEEGEIVGV
jgi:hypothetical protein